MCVYIFYPLSVHTKVVRLPHCFVYVCSRIVLLLLTLCCNFITSTMWVHELGSFSNRMVVFLSYYILPTSIFQTFLKYIPNCSLSKMDITSHAQALREVCSSAPFMADKVMLRMLLDLLCHYSVSNEAFFATGVTR